MAQSTSTLPAAADERTVARSHWLRRLFALALTVFLAFGALNFFGVRTRTVTAEGGGYTLRVNYAQVSRPGLATPWSLEITRDGGFDGPVEVAVNSSFFDVFDENGLTPAPTSEASDAEWISYEFDPPEGDTLVVSFDARVEPGVQLERVKGTARVMDGADVAVEATYTMWVAF